MRTRDLVKKAKKIIGQPVSLDDTVRPKTLESIVGQATAVKQAEIACQAAKQRGDALPNTLLTGPGGMGKTTFAQAMANAMGNRGDFVATTASMINTDNLIKTLTTIKPYSIIFIDEIHGLTRKPMELLYGAMEDGHIDSAQAGTTERIDLPPFTVIGATTLPGRLEASFKDRFELTLELSYYSITEIEAIIERSAKALGCVIDSSAVELIADRSKDVPRVANSLLNRCRDMAQVEAGSADTCHITAKDATSAFELSGIDSLGLDKLDQRYLLTLWERFKGGPIGVVNMASAVGSDTNTLQSDVEPFLIRRGLVVSTPRGRRLSADGRQHVRDMGLD